MVDKRQRASIFVMLALRSERATLQQICDYLSHIQSPTPRKGRWYCATVKKILDQNAGLASLLPYALRAFAPERLASPHTSLAICSVGEKSNPNSRLAQQQTSPLATREPAYAPSERNDAGRLVHKYGS